MKNKINKIIDFFIKHIEKEDCKGDMDVAGLLMSVRDKEVVIELFKDTNKVDTIKFDKQELLNKKKENSNGNNNI